MHKLLLKMGYKNHRGQWDMEEIKVDAIIFGILVVCVSAGLYFG